MNSTEEQPNDSERKIADCFGDTDAIYDGGWFANYDGKYVDITNDVVTLSQMVQDEILKARIDELRDIRLGKFTNHLFQHKEYCVPTKDIDSRIEELSNQLKTKEER